MAKEKKERFVLTVRLAPDKVQRDILNKRMEIGRRIYNQCVAKTRRQYNEMVKTKRYREIETELRAIRSQKEEDGKEKQTSREKELKTKRSEMLKEFGFSEFAMGALAIKQSKAFSMHIDSTAAQSIGGQLWQAWETFFFRNGEDVGFRKFGQFNSLGGANNKSGITIQKNYTHPSWEGERTALVWGRTSRCINIAIPLKFKKNDDYAKEALENEIALCRIIRKPYKNKDEFYAQIVLKKKPPVKINKETEELLHPLGRGLVDIKVTRDNAIVTKDGESYIFDLADRVADFEKQKQEIHRAMTRSRIATNPDKYNADGTSKSASRVRETNYYRSKNYMRLKQPLKELERKSKDVRKEQHNILANRIAAMGDTFVVTHPDFKKEQKNNGKDIAKKAPSAFLNVLKWKISLLGGNITEEICEE